MATRVTGGTRIVLLCVALAFATTCILRSPAAEENEHHVTLSDALDNKLVQATICGIGLSSGYAILMAIKSGVGYALQVNVGSGTILRSNDSDAQSMVVHRVEAEYDGDVSQDIAKECVKQAMEEEKRVTSDQGLSDHWLETNSLSLEPYQADLYLLSGYCLEFEKDNPSSSVGFSVAGRGNDETEALFRYLDQNPTEFEPVAIQLATWAVNGDVSGQHISEKFPFSPEDKDAACRLLRLSGIDADGKALCSP